MEHVFRILTDTSLLKPQIASSTFQKRMFFFLALLLFIPFLYTSSAEAASTYYVRAGATGGSNGSDWNNAFSNLPATLVRDATYYIADGSYSSRTYSDPPSGSMVITLKKATVSDHGTDVGWNNTYGDGQASLGSLTLVTDYYVFDGATRNESSWNEGLSYGFRAASVYSNTLNFGHCPDYVTIRYVDIGATYSETYQGGYDRSLYLGGFSETCDNWTIERNFVHNTFEVQLAGANNTTIQYNWFGPTWGKEVIRGQVQATNTTVRYNVFRNACRDDHAPGNGCTGEVMVFGNLGDTPNFEGFFVYGNIVWKTINQHKTDGTFGANANNCKIYNNTIYDNGGGVGNLGCFTGAGSEIRDNIGYFTGGMAFGCTSSTCNNNSTYTLSPPFVNASSGNFHLTAQFPGVSLPSPYNSDMDGRVRGADGVWDRGAYEYVGGGGGVKTPNPPSIIQVQ